MANNTCSIYTIDEIPSLRSVNYQVSIIVDSRGEVVPCSRSRCTCPAGRLFCSHMLGFPLVCYAIQQKKYWSVSEFATSFPEPVKALQAAPELMTGEA